MNFLKMPFLAYRQPVICFLADAMEPISAEQLAALCKLPLSRVIAELRDWKEFLEEEQIVGQKRYRIYHTSFQDFLRQKDEVGEVDLTGTHRAIAEALSELWRNKNRAFQNSF